MISKADAKRRIVLPAIEPGDVFDIRRLGDGQFVLVRLERPQPPALLDRQASLNAMAAAPLLPTMTWDEIRKLTREP